MHGCSVRLGSGGAGPATLITLAGFALVLVAAARAAGPVRVPLPQILAEAEQAIAARQPGDAAGLLDMVLVRVADGERLPSGLALERLQLAAATTHFQSQNLARAQALAETLIAARPSSLVVGEARMILGLSLALQDKFAEAVPVFGALEELATHRDRARLYRAMAAQQAGQIDVAIDAYTRLLGSAPRDADWADAALVLVSLHLQQKNVEEARRGLALLQGQREWVDNLAGLNALSLQLGDALLAEGDAEGALAAYRMASAREDLLRDQAQRHARMEAQIAQARARLRGPAAELDAFRRLEARAARAQTAQEQLEKLPGYDAALYYRVGHAFQEHGSPWEAALAFGAVLAGPADAPERPRAHQGLVRAYAEAGRFARADRALSEFASAHPGDPLVLQALYAVVMAAQERGAAAVLERFLERAEVLSGPDDVREPLLVLHTQVLLATGRHEAAREKAAAVLARYPRGRLREDLSYLHAMAGMLLGRQERAVAEIEAHLTTYPNGRYEDDARYRLAAAHYAMEEYDGAARLAGAWLRERTEDHPQRGEVLALLGDAWAGLGRLDEAIASYRRALDTTMPDQLLGYVLDELTRHHQSRLEYDEAVAMWEAFARERPDHPFVLNAAYWIGRIRLREGRLDEAQVRVAEIAGRYLADPERDGVERLLGELAGMFARPPRPGPDGRRPPALTPDELATRIETLLLNDRVIDAPTARARVLFTQAETAALRKEPDVQAARMDQIAAQFPLSFLPAGVLGRLGDHLLAGDRGEEARACYDRIISQYERSVFADFGFAGLGELALREGRPEEALKHFEAAVDRAGARHKLREATLGRARALLALDQLEEAREVFEYVAGNRSWRGEATAESVYALGEIHARRGDREDLAKAQAHFQRVYVSYRKYTPWVARAYLRSAETFVRLGQFDEAGATLREMLRDDRIASRPEAAEARGRLAEYTARGLVQAGGPEG